MCLKWLWTELWFDSTEASDHLTAQEKRLKDAEKKKKALEKDLMDAQAELNNIVRGKPAQIVGGSLIEQLKL
jgi:hypothetical protein